MRICKLLSWIQNISQDKGDILIIQYKDEGSGSTKSNSPVHGILLVHFLQRGSGVLAGVSRTFVPDFLVKLIPPLHER